VKPAIFLDRDGTVIFDRGYLSDPAGVEIMPGAVDALRRLNAAGYLLIFISNQSGIGRGMMTEEQSNAVHRRTLDLLAAEGIAVAGSYICPHAPWENCQCRKPSTVLLQQAAAEHGIDAGRSVMIGDKVTDVEMGRAAGCRAILYGPGVEWSEIADQILKA
jgi:D-glycero-D-manno-heptose 1,7-bisphosphate phosphatase